MASEQQVRQYLAYWFQLGKGVVVDSDQKPLRPCPVIQGDRYSQEFEACWQQVRSSKLDECYLEGTHQTIAQLLTPSWEVNPCARCSMPIPIKSVGLASLECPCIDIPNWPNTAVPTPRGPIDSQSQLSQIRDRLRQATNRQ